MAAYDPDAPANNSLISSSQLRDQFNGLKLIIDVNATDAAVAIQGTAMNPSVDLLSQSISNPPTQAQVQAIQDKINELISAISRPIS